ncbi:MAG: hypothetical protein V1726_04070 [Methanobacteriota archaeon]
MSRFLNNADGFMGLTLSQLGLMIATGILLAAVFSFLFLSDWQRNAELTNIATSFSTLIEGMDSRYFENTSVFHFPEKEYPYTVTLSTEYIVVSAKGHWNNDLSMKQRLQIQPWPQNRTINPLWVQGDELHNYLNQTYQNSGTIIDPIDSQNITDVQLYLANKRNTISSLLAIQPLSLRLNQTVSIDKVVIYYDTNGNRLWENEFDEKQDFVLVYQYE